MIERTQAATEYSRGCMPLSRLLPLPSPRDGTTRPGLSVTVLRFESWITSWGLVACTVFSRGNGGPSSRPGTGALLHLQRVRG
jgi:hypothetical protein